MNILSKTGIVFFIGIVILSLGNCTTDNSNPDFHGYPKDIGKIVYTKCATSGCHTDASKDAASGLSMETWDGLFAGGHNGPAVIPYRSDFSPLCYFINTYSDLGMQIAPTMPYNKTPLSKDEVILFKNWIDCGAPDINGFRKFSDDPMRKKYYVTNQGCDVVTVFDEATQLPMRFINVGSTAGNEAPHMIKVSPDGQYWYVISLAGLYLEKYRTSDDCFIGRVYIGSGYWNAFTISDNSQTAYCTDMSPITGKVAIVDLTAMTATTEQPFNYPHGVTLNKANDMLYITEQVGSSKMYKVPVADFSGTAEINLYVGAAPALPLEPHEVAFVPDATGSKYFVTCQKSSEVRVFNTTNDSLETIISVGGAPSEMSFSTDTTLPYLFITCTEDTLSNPGKRGSVAVINYQTNTFITSIYTGWQPHGIVVDQAKKQVLVVNRNFKDDGPAPHHGGECGGRNGYVTFIDMNSLQMVPSYNGTGEKKIEIASDPYSAAIRK